LFLRPCRVSSQDRQEERVSGDPSGAIREELDRAERAAKAIQDKLDRLDEAFLFERSIDIETYDRHAEKLREELTLARIDRHSGQLEELDVEGILAFAGNQNRK
jgi:hypothetical protein